jgi:hypothetical protein
VFVPEFLYPPIAWEYLQEVVDGDAEVPEQGQGTSYSSSHYIGGSKFFQNDMVSCSIPMQFATVVLDMHGSVRNPPQICEILADLHPSHHFASFSNAKQHPTRL